MAIFVFGTQFDQVIGVDFQPFDDKTLGLRLHFFTDVVDPSAVTAFAILMVKRMLDTFFNANLENEGLQIRSIL